MVSPLLPTLLGTGSLVRFGLGLVLKQSPVSFVLLTALLQSVLLLLWAVYVAPQPSPLRKLPLASQGPWWSTFLLEPATDDLERFMNETANNGLIRYFGVFHGERLLITKSQGTKEMMLLRAYNYDKLPLVTKLIGQVTGQGLLVTAQDEHKRQRKSLLPAFKYKYIKDLFPRFWFYTTEFVAALEKEIDRVGEGSTAVVDVEGWMMRATLDVVAGTGFGVEVNAIAKPDSDLAEAVATVEFHESEGNNLSAFGLPLAALAGKQILDPDADDDKSRFESQTATETDVVSTLLRFKEPLTDKELMAQSATILAAGQDTTSVATTWALYLLAHHPHVQSTLRSEVHKHLPSPDMQDETVDAPLIESLPYLAAVCNETLRLFPQAPVLRRHVVKSGTVVLGEPIPVGTVVMTSIWGTHRMKSVWGPDAGEFKPECFLQYDGDGKMNFDPHAGFKGEEATYRYLPFALVSGLIGRFEWSVLDPAKMMQEDIKMNFGIVSKPEAGLRLRTRRVDGCTKTSEEFNTASRNVKPGLIAAGIVSAWTWAATLLQSSTVAYTYGVAGPFWYAAGATVQILMFSILACKTKMNAPRCHTYLEIINVRYGRVAHIIFIFFALVTNILVGSQLLLGGSAVVTSLTGMNVYAAIFLIPLGVVAYVLMGGLRATFLCDYSHTLILMVIILYFMFEVYVSDDIIGSPARMFELLKKAASQRPIDGNQDGSYLTLKSNNALIFGVIQLCSGSGTVFLDQAYWQRAIASRPTTAVRAYILGGLAWFAIPFGFATTLGLASAALVDNPAYPTYPDVPSSSQISAGLASAFAASTLLGKGGAVALLITLFMAVTSCASAELIAVSSILTFDVYKTYIKPNATPQNLIFMAHVNVAVFGLTMAIFAIIWNVIGIDLGWLFLVMGLLIGGAVMPTAFAITWKKQSRAGAIAGSLSGLVAGLTAWLVEAKVHYGELTLETTGSNFATLAGNLAAIMTGLIVTVVVSLIKPDNYDWSGTRAINIEHALHVEGTTPSPQVDSSSASNVTQMGTGDKDAKRVSAADPIALDEERQLSIDARYEDNPSSLRSAFKLACIASFVLPFIMDFLIPIPMFLSHYIFSKEFFTAWVVISFIWVFASSLISVLLPIWETRAFFGVLFRAVTGDIRGRRGAA
ncbi:hypothetical protein G647_06046 [Cladophialophora carrionii CBS 160.54]|uniref:Urea active transporter n=1 Tax=Cladophialophora carrionii CBS 160.54 TaxID=1279043 RepID=V9D5Q3_9EURO|nr:uncharacterized protein G647_06046 [Cladophialophora carrionii CBS 160.54]ETI21976.1 hypothetical protein G647_06046 [Cladophialophora carrionii CBS 160.54]